MPTSGSTTTRRRPSPTSTYSASTAISAADHHDLRPVPRRDAGAHLVSEVRAAFPDLLRHSADPYVWIACDTATTRALTSCFRKEAGLPKQRVDSLGYWRP